MRRARHITRLGVGGLLLLLGAHAGATPVAVVGPLTHLYRLGPGEKVEGAIEVQNLTDQPRAVDFYQTDYFFSADGRVQYGAAGHLPRSNARWIAFGPKQIVVPPRQSAKLRYSIEVPGDRGLKGTYWSVMMVRPVPEPAPQAGRPNDRKVSVTIREVFQYAVQIVTDIGTGASREMRFANISLLRENGRPMLVVDVENTGEQMLSGTMLAELSDLGGQSAGRFEGGRQRLYPGTSARFKAELAGLRHATYRALIIFDCGGDDVFAARANLVPGH